MTIAQSLVNIKQIKITFLKLEWNEFSEYVIKNDFFLYWKGSKNLFKESFGGFLNEIKSMLQMTISKSMKFDK